MTSSAWPANDPSLLWKSLQTEHFYITYYSGEEEIAFRIARLAELLYQRIGSILAIYPKERVEIVLTDQSEHPNGSATLTPYSTIRLSLTAPEELSELGNPDDWYLDLLTHEYTHAVHGESIGGLPALINALFGKLLVPNFYQPHFIVEGLAVVEESLRTSAGRLRSSQWKMMMRADVLENHIASLDQFSHPPRRWPQGNIWYLYGSFFMDWIADSYGEEVFRSIIEDYGRQPIPGGLNRALRHATGKTYEELYPHWIAASQQQFAEEAATIRAHGLQEGIRITKHGQIARNPRWFPSKQESPTESSTLMYYRSDGHSTPGLYQIKLPSNLLDSSQTHVSQAEFMLRTNDVSTPAFTPEGGVVFEALGIHKNLFRFFDLFAVPPRQRGVTGVESTRVRMTRGFRAKMPDVSPDGTQIVFVTQHRGTSYLQIADFNSSSLTLEHVRALLPSQPLEQAYAPRWSPDGRAVTYTAWTKGGYREIRVIDLEKKTYQTITHRRGLEGGPCFSPDGKNLFFSSDRSGISNIYSYALDTRVLKQVTNVLTGAFQPSVSPDGKSLVYVGYTSEGYDLFILPLDEQQWTNPSPYSLSPPLPPPPSEPPATPFTKEDYQPLRTLAPRQYFAQTAPGNFGQSVTLSIAANDIASIHTIRSQFRIEWNKPELQGNFSYIYARLPFDVGIRAFRRIAPAGWKKAAQNSEPNAIRETIGFNSFITIPMPGAYDHSSFNLSYNTLRIGYEPTSITASKGDPYAMRFHATSQLVSQMHVGWSYSNTQRFLWSVTPEKGLTAKIGVDANHNYLTSAYDGVRGEANVASYFPMPWLPHHTLTLSAGGGLTIGKLPDQLFFVGGATDPSFLEGLLNETESNGGIILRGYPVGILSGKHYILFNAEYHFPIINIDRGLATLPFFLNRIHGNTFIDYGSAFYTPSTARFKTGIGGELQLDSHIGYSSPLTFRLGYSYGLSQGGIQRTYFLASTPF
ncbi:PD40 domain-containing protein [Pajaroellobacter abortibovis]|uniref:Bacterial surface antigen (D15) domain-containing protein n=1 Tax=Pajaroellobacter abortibovis TaxID=1882918 RepID=A0A1L6MUV8_9BACT|nr:PD40 domain-containing protein [Pajaroellobacter abortibovis]APR99292.1 hypothetical protein BCY86_00335 [Pajaroellobacter abortibovis]